MRKLLTYGFVLFASAVIFGSCDPNPFTGIIKEGTRNITIDVDNSMFRLPTAVNAWEQGPGMASVTLTILLESGNVEVPLSAADASAGDYTQLVKEVSGKLLGVNAAAVNAAGTSFPVSIEDKAAYETFTGWEIFANVTRFKLAYSGNSTDGWADGFMTFDIAPRGGAGLQFKVDSGITAAMTTDWGGDPLTTRQLAVEPQLSENPAGLTFDIYTLVVDENLRELYKPGYITPGADYEYYPWEDVWTHEELTSTGKKISDTVYKPVKYNSGNPLPFIEPSGAGLGYNSFLIDLAAVEDNPVGKFLLIAVVSKYDVLSVPSIVDIVEIR